MPKETIQLSDHFTYSRLLRFVLPCIGTMLFTSVYGIVDGLCVSNFVGKTAFAAVNLIMPLPQLLGTVGFMLGTGGSAIVGITLGEGDQKKADRYFTMFLLAALISVSVLAVLGILLLRPVAMLLGAKGELLDYAVRYGRILMLALPPFALQNMFQSFFVTAEKPLLGFWFTVGAGCTNMVLDVVMVGMLHWGVEGAAVATLISQLVGGVLPVFYFIDHHNTSRLHLCRTQFYGRVLWDACINGSSELMTNLSMSLVNILYNFQLLRLAGENGVAAYGVIMYAAFLFVAVFVGYAVGSAPIVSFHYGARNHAEVHNLYQKSLRLIAVVAVTMTAASMVIIPYVARIFVGYDAQLLALTSRAFRLYALSFLIMGFNVYASSFFTALGDGVTSALISFLRTLVFQLAALLLLPALWGIDGVWLAVTAAELAALAVSVYVCDKRPEIPLPSWLTRHNKKAAGTPAAFLLFKGIFHQLAVFDARSGVLLVGHIVKIGVHHPGDAVVRYQQVGLAGVCLQLVQQVVDALCQLHHAFAAVIAVGKVGLGDAELRTVPGRALVFAKALLPQAGLAAGGQTGCGGNGLCGVGGAGEGRVQDLVDVQAAVPDKLAQLPRLLLPVGGQRTVGHAADLIFHVPYRLAVAGEIDIMHKITPYSLCRVPSGSRQTVSPSSMPRHVSSLSG